ncbi:MAG: hypothetical protein ACRDPY_28340 [Streptosporangiaceae bacterium]
MSRMLDDWDAQRRRYPRLALVSTRDMLGAELEAAELDLIASLAGLGPAGAAVFCAAEALVYPEVEAWYRRRAWPLFRAGRQ